MTHNRNTAAVAWLIVLAFMAGVFLVAPTASTAQADHPKPDDVTVGKPADIPQDLFAQIRTMCAAKWTTEFDMRVFCERKQFEAIRKLRGSQS